VLNAVIDFSLRHRWLVIAATAACALGGVWSLRRLSLDAFPDTTPVQIQVNTTAPALGPEEVERQITAPIEQAISGLPRLREVRSISRFGLSQVVVTFDDGTDIYFARQVVGERLGTAELPQGVPRPRLGPVATGLGEVFHYALFTRGGDLAELRTTQDWVVRPKLRTVRGAAEINSWGGCEKTYLVRIDPTRLLKHGLTLDAVVEAVVQNNRNVGGGSLNLAGEALLVHGVARLTDLDQVKGTVVAAHGGVPVRVADVADVEVGHEIRRGAVTADGKGEIVLGLGFMLMGENSRDVTSRLKERLAEAADALPGTVAAETLYDRTELVDRVLDTVRQNLFEGGLLVVAVLFLFLGNLRAGLIVALAIPLSLLFAFSGMLRFGVAASLLSLGAIDFGLVVDSSVVMVENCVRHLARDRGPRTIREVVRDAAVEVRRPTLFGELIIMIVYLPILTLEGVEGKLFRPMALTVIFALAGSMVLSLTLMPVLASLLLPRRPPAREPLAMRVAHRVYAPVLRFAMRNKLAVLGFAACLLVFAFGLVAPNLGAEFVPRLSEGALVVEVTRPAGTSLEESIRYNTQIERHLLAAFPGEVLRVWSRAGTAEVATDPMGVESSDVFISLKARARWRPEFRTQDDLAERLEKEIRDLPGQQTEVTQPIEQRVNEMTAGVKSQVAVKLFGDDYKVLTGKAREVEAVLRTIDGSADVKAERVAGQPVLTVRVRPDDLARYGVPARAVLDLVESLGSKALGEVVEGALRFPLAVRLPEAYRTGPEAVAAMLVATPAGERIPLGRLADVRVESGPSTITREWGQRRMVVTCNVRGRDLGGFVAEARQQVADHVALPPGRYSVEWGGQFEHLERARTRLLIVVPVALALIFGLLYLTYENLVDALRVFTGVPFAWVGGVIALWVRDMPFSISAAVGFIALSGVAVLDDMILVSSIRQLRRRGVPLDEAVEQAARTRLRPVLMTTLVASLGFVPMAFSTGMGAEVQRPLATVVIGGVLSAMVMSLLVLRVLYVVFQWPRRREAAEPPGRQESAAASA
jgi:cobalt-zinc-cadmium resistance protein CzcA